MSESISIKPVSSSISKWGEGPIFWNDHLLYVDIEGHALVSLDPKTGEERIWEIGERIGTVVPRQSGGFVCAGEIQGYFPLIQKLAKKKIWRTLNLINDQPIVLMMENAIRQEDLSKVQSVPLKRRVTPTFTCSM